MDSSPIGVEECQIERTRRPLESPFHLQHGTCQIVSYMRENLEVSNGRIGKRDQPAISEYPTEPPLILIFEIGRVRPLIDAHRDVIASTNFDIVGNVEFTRISGALTVAHVMPVDPHIEGAVYAFEPQPNLLVRPLTWDFELAEVGSGGIDIGDFGRCHGKWKVEIGVMGISIALSLPHPRHLCVSQLVFHRRPRGNVPRYRPMARCLRFPRPALRTEMYHSGTSRYH